jgi:hypothetical protein
VIDLASLNVVDGTEGAKGWIGYPAWFLLNPTVLREGGTIQRGAWVLSDDAQSDVIKSVNWSVGELQTIQIKNYGASAWSLSFTGPHRGNYYHNLQGSKDYSIGSETVTYLFNSVYGLQLGSSYLGDYKLDRSDGGFTETYSETMQIDDTNLEFSVPTTSSVMTTPPVVTTTSIVTETVATTPPSTPTPASKEAEQITGRGLIVSPEYLIIAALIIVILLLIILLKKRITLPAAATTINRILLKLRSTLKAGNNILHKVRRTPKLARHILQG